MDFIATQERVIRQDLSVTRASFIRLPYQASTSSPFSNHLNTTPVLQVFAIANLFKTLSSTHQSEVFSFLDTESDVPKYHHAISAAATKGSNYRKPTCSGTEIGTVIARFV